MAENDHLMGFNVYVLEIHVYVIDFCFKATNCTN